VKLPQGVVDPIKNHHNAVNDESTRSIFNKQLFRIIKYLLILILVVFCIVASMISYAIGMSPEAGGTYSNPLTNFIGTLVIFSLGLLAWTRSRKRSDSPDAFASWLHSKTANRDEGSETEF
jgi:hypothetical protein